MLKSLPLISIEASLLSLVEPRMFVESPAYPNALIPLATSSDETFE